MLKLIVAHDQARGIGLDGGIPWNLPGELAWVAQVTRATTSPQSRNALVMGRLTYESILPKRRPLAGRVNVVVSSRPVDEPDVVVAASLDSALEATAKLENIEDVYLFGGGSIYRQALDALLPDELLVTAIEGGYDCDTFFPQIPDGYVRTESRPDSYGGVPVTHDVYARRPVNAS